MSILNAEGVVDKRPMYCRVCEWCLECACKNARKHEDSHYDAYGHPRKNRETYILHEGCAADLRELGAWVNTGWPMPPQRHFEPPAEEQDFGPLPDPLAPVSIAYPLKGDFPMATDPWFKPGVRERPANKPLNGGHSLIYGMMPDGWISRTALTTFDASVGIGPYTVDNCHTCGRPGTEYYPVFPYRIFVRNGLAYREVRMHEPCANELRNRGKYNVNEITPGTATPVAPYERVGAQLQLTVRDAISRMWTDREGTIHMGDSASGASANHTAKVDTGNGVTLHGYFDLVSAGTRRNENLFNTAVDELSQLDVVMHVERIVVDAAKFPYSEYAAFAEAMRNLYPGVKVELTGRDDLDALVKAENAYQARKLLKPLKTTFPVPGGFASRTQTAAP